MSLKPKTSNLKPNAKPIRGFTLIETLIYATLLSIIIGLVVGVTFQIVEGSKRLNTKVFLEEEASFMLRRIGWGMTGAYSIDTPAPGATSTSLSVQTSAVSQSENPLVFSLSDGELTMKRGNNAQVALNSGRVTVQLLEFEHIAPVGERTAGVKVNMTLVTKNPLDLRSYDTTIYLRQ